MATIKSFTDISQSKILAKILPLESADMHYKVNRYSNESRIFIIPYSELGCYKDDEYHYCVCAWSLPALLSVIKEQGFVDLRFLQSTFDNRGNHLTNVWCCTFEDIGTITLDLYADNPVDACYEIIIKLHKLNLL